jgi:hypothetical protein
MINNYIVGVCMETLLKKLESEITKRNLDESKISEILKNNKDIINRRIIVGYASVAVVDREGQLIPIPALKEAVKRFMSNIYYRPANVFHSDVTIGRILQKWTNPDTGELFETKVDDKGWLVVVEIRDDVDIAKKVWEEVIKGNIRSFSIAGSSKDKLQKYENGRSFEQVNSLDLFELTLCVTGVNQLSRFSVAWNPDKVSI